MHVEICSSSRIELCDLLGLAKGKQYEELLDCIPSKSLRNHECFRKSTDTNYLGADDGKGSKSQPKASVTIENIRKGQNLASSKLPFLWKMHEMLDDVEKTGDDHIVSWLPHGQAFRVHKPKSFVQKIIPHYFKQSKYKSFQRQLHLYDFVRTPRGEEAGAYRHPLFVRGKKSLCLSLSPHKIKGKNQQNQLETKGLPVQTITPSTSFDSGKSSPQNMSRKRTRSDSDETNDIFPTAKRNSTFTFNDSQRMAEEAQQQANSTRSMGWTRAIQNVLVTGASLAAELEAKKGKKSNSTSNDANALAPHNGDVVYAFGGKPFRFIENLAPERGEAAAGDKDTENTNICCDGDEEDEGDLPPYDGEDEELLARATDSTMEDLLRDSMADDEELCYSTLATEI